MSPMSPMKTILCAAALCAAVAAPGGPPPPPQTARTPQFENDAVKVWRSVIAPGQPLAMHRHDHPRVILALRGGTLKIVDEGGAGELNAWEAGHAYWLPANPPGRQHADVNAGDHPIEVMVVELKHER